VPTNAHEHTEVSLFTPRTPTRFGQVCDRDWSKHVGSCCVYKLQHAPVYLLVLLLHILGTLLVAQLVEALRYKSEGRGFDSRRCQWNFSLK